jgi:small nuclear ribonucleoprotein E
MSGRQGGNRGKVLLPPINFIFRLLQQQIPCSIWLYEQLNTRIEGKIRVCKLLRSLLSLTAQGFDEFMNLVVDDAVEVMLPTNSKDESRRNLGIIAFRLFSNLAKLRQDASFSRATTSR